MNVLVDTSVWSLALRRREPEKIGAVQELHELILEGRAQLIGAIRQEVLSGIRDQTHFHRLREHLRAFPDLPTAQEDFELAAEFFNQCRRQGVQGSNTDFLLCAVAHQRHLPVLTTDLDFSNYAQRIPVRLHKIRADFQP